MDAWSDRFRVNLNAEEAYRAIKRINPNAAIEITKYRDGQPESTYTLED